MSSLEDQVQTLQQQLAALQQQLNNNTSPMDSISSTSQLAEDTAPLHSVGTRPHYDWTPSEFLNQFLQLDTHLYTSPMLTDNDRKSIIENYPPLASLDYRPPSSVPTAERLMNKAQRMEDHSLKRLQYLTSAVFRPLDILAHELFSTETDNPNLERYLTMLRDVRKLLLHVCASMTQDRNNIALRAVNPSFSLRSEYTGQYTMPLDEFQQTLAQQTATRKATREATNRFQRKRYNGTTGRSQQQHLQSFQRPLQQQHKQQQQHEQQQLQPQQQQQKDQQSFSPATTPVGGRLSKFASAWTKISSNQFVNNIIQYGYSIPFHTPPPLTTSPVPIIPYSIEQQQMIDKAIQDLLLKSAIEPVTTKEAQQTPGFYSSIFVIPKKNGGIRPVFNLKRLNQYLDPPPFKMETIREVAHLLRKNDYLVSVDLSDAFLHIPVHPDSRKFLRFKWKSQIYQYTTTPFGLAPVPYLFTKICRPILEWARTQGIRVSAYLDDWILAAKSRKLALQHTNMLVQQLQQLGWIVNTKKSVLSPTRNLEHLGFCLDTTTMTASLPAKKIRDLRRSIKQIISKPHSQTPRTIHSLTMRIQAATFAVFPARLYTRHLLYYKNKQTNSSGGM
ncbi:hypothetical protein G6F25_006029 [Rhizopus arrhizus]|nr:hypothetical protein G6F24_009691 [Rhizopus arrhizus]KAG0809493.1 hypothetical protein G6F20_008734 [Rhizopus arrhizus]KAG1038856.1 hypothetical protein G6F25_006029 [Rhizopus arrhizus]KAG1184374.1 hypothetical protein G6F36_007747 [Rhizopus arrhizus]